ncbi:hypothetical protein BD626DRAFT_61486 [Schizophyllum amplum]|uniref:Uncharacterized protein n=1 Tax=Schizophyllum amplum TaxID=97359 RepID=A0A550CCE1_9AGAR|nr:hypothetical protein BD626DRAFT_61486 [Auriculariopsis ampla]
MRTLVTVVALFPISFCILRPVPTGFGYSAPPWQSLLPGADFRESSRPGLHDGVSLLLSPSSYRRSIAGSPRWAGDAREQDEDIPCTPQGSMAKIPRALDCALLNDLAGTSGPVRPGPVIAGNSLPMQERGCRAAPTSRSLGPLHWSVSMVLHFMNQRLPYNVLPRSESQRLRLP